MANKRYGSVAWAKSLKLGDVLKGSNADLRKTASSLSGIASNIHYRGAKKGIASTAIGTLERSLISIHGKVSFKVPTGNLYKTYNSKEYGVKVQRSISENQRLRQYITALYNYINSEGSTITGAKKELQEARDRLGNQSLTFDDIKDFWEIYESQRAEIEANPKYEEVYMPMIVEWMTTPDAETGEYLTKEEIKTKLKEALKGNKPSDIPEGELKKSGKKMRR